MPKDRDKGRRDTYEKREVYATIRDIGDKRNNVPPANPNKHYKSRSKYDGKGRLKDAPQ